MRKQIVLCFLVLASIVSMCGVMASSVNADQLWSTNPQVAVYNASQLGDEWEWTETRREGNSLYAVAWIDGQYVAVGDSGTIIMSEDGVAWMPQASGTTSALLGIAWNGTRLVVVGERGLILTSLDGVAWTLWLSGSSRHLLGVTWGGGQYIAVGQGGTIFRSPDGVSWRPEGTGTNATLRSILWNDDQYVAVGYDGTILTSPDGVRWTSRDSDTEEWLFGIASSEDLYVAVGYEGSTLTSPDGVVWTLSNSGNMQALQGIIWNGIQFTSVGVDGSSFTSLDGVTWELRDTNTSEHLRGIAWGEGQYVAVGHGGIILRSVPISTQSINIAPTTNGTVLSNRSNGLQGDVVLLTLAPDLGYEVDTLLLNGVTVTPHQNTYQFAIGSEDVYVEATFKPLTIASPPLATLIGQRGYTVNGVFTDMAPCYYKGRDTMMPVRMLQAFGMEFGWEQETGTATLSYSGNTIVLRIGSTQAIINGVSTPIVGASGAPMAPELAPGRTMIPLRFVSEKLGFKVHWDPSNTITISLP